MEKMITVNDCEQRIMTGALNHRRTESLAGDKPTEDINSMLLNVIDAPTKKERIRDSEER